MAREEQLTLNLYYENQINKICDLRRSDTPLISKVEIDDGTKKASENFDFDFDGENKFYPFEIPEILENLKFQILVITGASGSGKSTFAKYFIRERERDLNWNNDKAIISNFDSPEVAVERLCAVGLNSIPTWCKPRNVLSVGEGFRADLARKLESNCVIDEFTSTVDRNIALSCSMSVSKYIRRKNLQNCVFVSCHKDFIDTLCPDYVIDLDDECIYDTRGLVRHKFELSIYQKTNKREIWNAFKQHHYLTSDFNVASSVFTAYIENELVGMCSVLPQPGVADGNAWRIHRLVVLPDYQGLGIATKLLEYVCDLFTYHHKIVYIRTSHIKLISYFKKSSKWYGDGKLRYSVEEAGELRHRKVNLQRKSASFKYIAPCIYANDERYNCLQFNEHKEKVEYLDLFNL